MKRRQYSALICERERECHEKRGVAELTPQPNKRGKRTKTARSLSRALKLPLLNFNAVAKLRVNFAFRPQTNLAATDRRCTENLIIVLLGSARGEVLL